MRKQQLLAEIVEGECHECGMIGPLIVKKTRNLCEICEGEFQELD